MKANSPLDVVVVFQVMSLAMLLQIVEDDHRGDKVDDFTRGKEENVVPAISSTIAISIRDTYQLELRKQHQSSFGRANISADLRSY